MSHSLKASYTDSVITGEIKSTLWSKSLLNIISFKL